MTDEEGIRFIFEHAARNFAYQQKAWFNRKSEVYFDGDYWICKVL